MSECLQRQSDFLTFLEIAMSNTIRPVLTIAEASMIATAIDSHLAYRATASQESAFDIEAYKILKRKLGIMLVKLGVTEPQYTEIREAAIAAHPQDWTASQCHMKLLESEREGTALPAEQRMSAYEYMIEQEITLSVEQNKDYIALLGI